MTAQTFIEILDHAQAYADDDWHALARDIRYPSFLGRDQHAAG